MTKPLHPRPWFLDPKTASHPTIFDANGYLPGSEVMKFVPRATALFIVRAVNAYKPKKKKKGAR